jgi:putative membrane protein
MVHQSSRNLSTSNPLSGALCQECSGRCLWKIRLFFVLFYSVGVAGLYLPLSRELFRNLIPLALLLSFATLMAFQPSMRKPATLLFFLFVWAASFLVEMAGVHTGKIFGVYTYGTGLGWKIHGTPLMIGINWLMLTLFFADLTDRTGVKGWTAPLVSAAGMVAYDLVLEQAAPDLDMWSWAGGTIPLQNFTAWFLLALVFQVLLRILRIPFRNPLSMTLLLCQFCFFLLLVLLFKFSG